MNIAKEESFTLRFIQYILLTVSVLYGGLYVMRGALFYSSLFMDMQIGSDIMIYGIVFSSLLMSFFLIGFIKLFYVVSIGIFERNEIRESVIKREQTAKLIQLNQYPVSFNDFKRILIWFIITYNIIIGSVRLFCFYHPYMYSFLESLLPPLINAGLMAMFFLYMRKKYIEDSDVKNVFVSMIIPYSFIILLFIGG